MEAIVIAILFVGYIVTGITALGPHQGEHNAPKVEQSN